jgi:TIR domain-containing protein
MDQSPGRDFFISYTATDHAWAQWIAVELERAGYTTVVQAFDFRPGADFVHQMHQATKERFGLGLGKPKLVGNNYRCGDT